MEVREPGRLTEVRALAGHLEMEPLLRLVFLGEGGGRVGDGVLGVVLIHQIFDDRTGFEDGDIRVRVMDRGDAVVEMRKLEKLDEGYLFSPFFSFWRRGERNILPAVGIHISVWLGLDGLCIKKCRLVRKPELFEDNDHLHCHRHLIMICVGRSLTTAVMC